MENTRLITYKCPICGGIVKFEGNGTIGICQSCGNTVEKERTVTLNYASKSSNREYHVDYVFNKDDVKASQDGLTLCVDQSKIEYRRVEFESVRAKDLSPQKAIELEGLIKKLLYGFDDIADQSMSTTVQNVLDIDGQNIYGEFLSRYLTASETWISCLKRQDALDISAFIVPYIMKWNEYTDIYGVKGVFDYLSAINLADAKKADIYRTILSYNTVHVAQSRTFSDILPMLSAIDMLEIKYQEKKELLLLAVYKLFQTSEAQEFATAVYFFVKNYSHDCVDCLVKLINDEVVTMFDFVQFSNVLAYVRELSELDEQNRIELEKLFLHFEFSKIDDKEAFLFTNSDEISQAFEIVKHAPISEKQKIAYYNNLIKAMHNCAFEVSETLVYLVKEGYSDSIVDEVVLMNQIENCASLNRLAYNLSIVDCQRKEQLIKRTYELKAKCASFEDAAEEFGFLKELDISAKTRNEIYLSVLYNIKENGQSAMSVFGYLSLYEFIDDSELRFRKLFETLLTFKDELFLKLTQFELLYNSGDLTDDEFLLCLDMMKKTIIYSVADSKMDMAFEEIDNVKEKYRLSSYSSDVNKGKNKEYVKWLSAGILKRGTDESSDKILEKVFLEESVNMSTAVKEKANAIAREKKMGIILPIFFAAFAILDIIFISLLFTESKYEWYFNVPQWARIIMDIIYVPLHVVPVIVSYVVFGKRTRQKYKRIQLLSTIGISIFAFAMLASFAASYAVVRIDDLAYEISSVEDLKKMKNMPYSDFKLVDNIVSSNKKDFDLKIKFHGRLDGKFHFIKYVTDVYEERPTLFYESFDGTIQNLRAENIEFVRMGSEYNYFYSCWDSWRNKSTKEIVYYRRYNYYMRGLSDEATLPPIVINSECYFSWRYGFYPGSVRYEMPCFVKISEEQFIAANENPPYSNSMNYIYFYVDEEILHENLHAREKAREMEDLYIDDEDFNIEDFVKYNDKYFDENGNAKSNYWSFYYYRDRENFCVYSIKKGESEWKSWNKVYLFD